MLASLLLWTHGTWPWEQRAAGACGPSASEAEALSVPWILLAADISSFQHLFPCAPKCSLSQSCPELLQCYRSLSGCPHSPSLSQTDEEQLY